MGVKFAPMMKEAKQTLLRNRPKAMQAAMGILQTKIDEYQKLRKAMKSGINMNEYDAFCKLLARGHITILEGLLLFGMDTIKDKNDLKTHVEDYLAGDEESAEGVHKAVTSACDKAKAWEDLA